MWHYGKCNNIHRILLRCEARVCWPNWNSSNISWVFYLTNNRTQAWLCLWVRNPGNLSKSLYPVQSWTLGRRLTGVVIALSWIRGTRKEKCLWYKYCMKPSELLIYVAINRMINPFTMKLIRVPFSLHFMRLSESFNMQPISIQICHVITNIQVDETCESKYFFRKIGWTKVHFVGPLIAGLCVTLTVGFKARVVL